MSASFRWLLAGALALACAPAQADPPLRHYTHEQVLGTSLRMSVAGASPATADAAHAAALAEIARLDAVFSTWREDSELARLNHATAPVTPSPELRRLLQLCEHWRTASDEAFSCRLGGPLQAWRDAAASATLPDRVQLRQQARALARLEPDLTAATVAPLPGLHWQADGVAKGHILDLALQQARQAAPDALGIALDIGGDALYWGVPARGGHWRVGVADPLAPADNAAPRATLQLASQAVASSGHRSRGFKVGRRHFSHLLDPLQGWPMAYPPSATVVAPDAASADALATALSVMPIRDGLAWVEQQPGVEALIVSDRGVSFASSGWHRLLAAEPGAPQPAAWTRPVVIEYEIPVQDSARYRAPYLALWIARPDGSPVRQLLVLGDRSRYLQELPQWWRLYGRDDDAAVHGIARPTRLPGHYTVAWDGRDDQGRPCPPGDYLIEVEAAREHGGRQRLSLALPAPQGQVRHPPRRGDEIGAVHAHPGNDAR
ncbi:DUF2271 domain-containing protein [Stenotrophomonas mori]|uniref:FAD:protein FMN transferase n=1 Tax=Stenotrophomonas mori TaxID=2871096 RepID=A0ABT0SI07_9GAMM|nr:DUF2271 domain-containing protein [Stenotrophomonas mori]MCL7714892.1 DUF2271 domain-containing protein [Stenotrophomonas mori]